MKRKKKLLSDDAKFKIFLIVVFAVLIGILALIYRWDDKSKKEYALRDKQCWKEISAIVEASPKEKADWIKLTIRNMAFRGDVSYCGALEFIKDGQNQ